jgi:predicted CXXCH cytochrome family protein
MRKWTTFLVTSAALVTAQAASIVATKHNLSAGGSGTVKAVTESQICIFCHTPHNGSREAPLWNRASSGQTYLPYSSTTAKAHPGQPTGDSRLCLSCHDGTVALGMVLSRPAGIQFQSGVTVLPAGPTRLGTDLGGHHPISFTYDAALASSNGQLVGPASLTGAVRLDGNSQMQCTACHDAHDNQNGSFLVMNNTASALCTTCHSQNYWSTSSHRTATKTWNGLGSDPWPHTSGANVQANACENCHRPHSAGNKPRLLNHAGEETNCFPCHNGNVAAKNIQAEFSKTSIHAVAATTGTHDPTEDPVNPSRHVECVDCHNPHAAKNQTAAVPAASGSLAGVKGVNSSGVVVNPLSNQYELCFRCHADSTNRGAARVPRQFVQTNTRLEFQSSNASYHPVLAAGKSTTGPSLIAPWTTASRMYCTDCHNNNTGPNAGGTGPKGPHGSAYVPLLERRLETTDNQAESAAIYALCYKCHSRTRITSTNRVAGSFEFHFKHVVEKNTACTTCHDPHGVSNQPHLINFNTAYVTRSGANAAPIYTHTASGGSCTLVCHGENHTTWTYRN